MRKERESEQDRRKQTVIIYIPEAVTTPETIPPEVGGGEVIGVGVEDAATIIEVGEVTPPVPGADVGLMKE